MSFLFFIFTISTSWATIDLNLAELEFLADHLELEQCRRLVAGAHFKTYDEPSVLYQAENKLPKDVPCIKLLLHWNSADGEGKGETHEILTHRLRQMGKNDLADWLSQTVFKELGSDLKESLEEGLQEFANDSSTTTPNVTMPLPTLEPEIVVEGPTNWLPTDSVLFLILCIIISSIFLICFYAFIKWIYHKIQARLKTSQIGNEQYEMIETEVSDTESEDKFDVTAV